MVFNKFDTGGNLILSGVRWEMRGLLTKHPAAQASTSASLLRASPFTLPPRSLPSQEWVRSAY